MEYLFRPQQALSKKSFRSPGRTRRRFQSFRRVPHFSAVIGPYGYDGSGTDRAGRTLKHVLSFDDDALEWTHDFIQWLFPLKERSEAQPSSPVLDDAAVESFCRRPELRANLRAALDRMLAFYGFVRVGDEIVDNPTAVGARHWLNPGNHNHLRLTRMLKSLRLLGEEPLANALFHRLSAISHDERRTGRNRITRETFSYWEDAVS